MTGAGGGGALIAVSGCNANAYANGDVGRKHGPSGDQQQSK